MFSRLPKKVVAAGVAVVSVAFLVGVLRPFEDARQRVLAEARASAEQADAMREASRVETCTVYLSYMSSCMGGDKDDCAVLSPIVLDYNDVYGGDASYDCIPGQDIAPMANDAPEESEPVAIITESEDPTNPLFFDGE